MIQKTKVLFIVPDGPRKGKAASPYIIFGWIRQTMVWAYALSGQKALFPASVQFTRAQSVSNAFHHSDALFRFARQLLSHLFTLLPSSTKCM